MILRPPALTLTEFWTALGWKVLLGVLYGYLFLHYYGGDDTWKIHRQSVKETRLLLDDPLQFFSREYTPAMALREAGDWKEALILYNNDLEYALVVKTISFFNLVSQGNYYINAVLFNVVAFWGHYWLFIALAGLFPMARKLLLAVIFFYLPVVFWLSGIRADGFLFIFFSYFLLQLFRRRNLAGALAAFVCITILRPQLAALLAVAVAGFLASRVFHRIGAWKVFTVTYLFGGLVFFVSGGLRMLAVKQEQFARLSGSRLPLQSLNGGIADFLQALPQAINHSFLRPYLWETSNVLQVVYAMESLFILFVLVILIPSGWRQVLRHPALLVMLGFALSLYVFTGLVVPFPGAIVRYKIIGELLLLCVAAVAGAEQINKKHNLIFFPQVFRR